MPRRPLYAPEVNSAFPAYLKQNGPTPTGSVLGPAPYNQQIVKSQTGDDMSAPYLATYKNTLGFHDIRSNNVYIAAKAARNEQVVGHELGHAVYTTLPDAIKDQWSHIHFSQIERDNAYNKAHPDVDEYPSDMNNEAIYRYPDDPSHSFAEMYGLYAGDPYYTEENYPRIYNWLKAVVGREYKHNNQQEANTVASHIPIGSENVDSSTPTPNPMTLK